MRLINKPNTRFSLVVRTIQTDVFVFFQGGGVHRGANRQWALNAGAIHTDMWRGSSLVRLLSIGTHSHEHTATRAYSLNLRCARVF